MRDGRPDTGPMKFGDDWTEVLIRGDDAMGHAFAVQHVLELYPKEQRGVAEAVPER